MLFFCGLANIAREIVQGCARLTEDTAHTTYRTRDNTPRLLDKHAMTRAHSCLRWISPWHTPHRPTAPESLPSNDPPEAPPCVPLLGRARALAHTPRTQSHAYASAVPAKCVPKLSRHGRRP